MTFELASDQLRAIVERVERLELEIKDLNADKSDIYKEARANGFDVKAIKQVVSKRKLDSADREEAGRPARGFPGRRWQLGARQIRRAQQFNQTGRSRRREARLACI